MYIKYLKKKYLALYSIYTKININDILAKRIVNRYYVTYNSLCFIDSRYLKYILLTLSLPNKYFTINLWKVQSSILLDYCIDLYKCRKVGIYLIYHVILDRYGTSNSNDDKIVILLKYLSENHEDSLERQFCKILVLYSKGYQLLYDRIRGNKIRYLEEIDHLVDIYLSDPDISKHEISMCRKMKFLL